MAALWPLILVVVFGSIDTVRLPALVNPPVGCSNYGTCRDNMYDPTNLVYYECMPYYCDCNDGTTPDYYAANPITGVEYPNIVQACYTATNHCISSPCPGQSKCIAYVDNYDCQCPNGYLGAGCTYDNSPCASTPCKNGGTCKNLGLGLFNCTCDANWLGERCDYENKCVTGNPCKNNQPCVMLFHGEKWFCNCSMEWQGQTCDDPTLTNVDQLKDTCIRVADGVNGTKVTSNSPTNAWCRNQLQTKVAAGADYKYYCLSGNECRMYVTDDWDDGGHADNAECNRSCWEEASPKKADYGGANDTCGNSKGYCDKGVCYPRGPCYQYGDTVDLMFCNSSICKNGGICYDKQGNTTACVCPREWQGPTCALAANPCGAFPSPCNGHGLCMNLNMGFNPQFYYSCVCNVGYTGPYCSVKYWCQQGTNPCLNGGMCVEKADHSGYTCDCLSLYTGDHCEEPNPCYSSPCIYGNCTNNYDALQPYETNYECECVEGYTGKRCGMEINYCESPPCQWGGTCYNVKPPAPPFYNCTCQAGTSGPNCEFNPDDCPYMPQGDGTVLSPCNGTDKKGQCIDDFNSWHCECGPDYTSDDCSIPIIVYNAIVTIFGKDAAVSDDIIQLLKDLLSNPTNIKDMVPFVLGLETETERGDKSWDYDDMFQWVAYEEKTLVLQRDLLKWNDVTLGNCFTFNHRNNTNAQYLHRMVGKPGSLEALLKVNSVENCPWVDTQAIQVFVHPAEEDIFSESVRYNSHPGAETELFPKLTAYQRLGGRYGVCVTETNQVKQYFYSGAYATDGCLRSCYQQAVHQKCKCMDPRYPMDKSVVACGLSNRSCVESISKDKGDPSKWPKSECDCPLPCSNRAYTVSWAKSVFSARKPQCVVEPNFNYSACRASFKDQVRVRVVLPDFTFQLFAEVPAMSFNSFIGNLGGLLGVLMGISTISFIEIGFLLLAIIIILFSCGKKNKT